MTREHPDIPVLYEDSTLVVVNKPAGLLVHKSAIDKHETQFLLQSLRDQLGCYIYPVHRLDKPTSGVIAFAKESALAAQLQAQLQAQSALKRYLLICRGYAPERGEINHPLKPVADFKRQRKKAHDKPAQDALTRFQTLAKRELNVDIDKYPTSRFSLVAAGIATGRKHQIRRHFKHLSHPIIGCPKYGKSRYNRFFSDTVGAPGLMLHAWQLEFEHPADKCIIRVQAPLPANWQQALSYMQWSLPD